MAQKSTTNTKKLQRIGALSVMGVVALILVFVYFLSVKLIASSTPNSPTGASAEEKCPNGRMRGPDGCKDSRDTLNTKSRPPKTQKETKSRR